MSWYDYELIDSITYTVPDWGPSEIPLLSLQMPLCYDFLSLLLLLVHRFTVTLYV